MYAFKNDKSYLIRQKMVLSSEGPISEDGCQSWLLIVTSYIALLITFHNKQFLILVWAFMANNNVRKIYITVKICLFLVILRQC